MKKYLAEFIGTFFLAFAVSTAAVGATAGELAPFAVGLTLAVMVYAGGPVSGAHYNPAVTTAMVARGNLAVRDVAPYMVSQLLGAAAAAGVAMGAFGVAGQAAAAPIQAALVAEFAFTFALVFVIFSVAVVPAAANNSYFGAAIGGTVLAGALTVGSISGAVFNPAVGLALLMVGATDPATFALFVVVQIVAALAAMGAINLVHGRA